MGTGKRCSVVFLLIALVISGCGEKDETANEGVGEKPGSVNAPDSDISQGVEDYDYSVPEFFPWNCEDFTIGEESGIGLYYEWTSMTEEQNNAFFEAVEHHVYVNGAEVSVNSYNEGLNGVEDDGQGNKRQLYWINIGSYPAGTYNLRNVIEVTEPVFDGWDWYGPDSENPTMESGCSFTVTAGAGNGDDSAPPSEAPDVPAPSTASCSISSPIREDWATAFCETFDTSTTLWIGRNKGTTTRLENGQYIIDNATEEAKGYTTGFTFPVFVGSAANHMISVDGELDSIFRDCTWGVFVRSTDSEIVYFFMINNQGRYTLTGSTENEAAKYLGNIDAGSHNAIVWDGVNNITAVADGRMIEFYINDKLITEHEAINGTNASFGLIVWGGEGVTAISRFDNLIVRIK